MKPLEDL